MKFTIRGTLPNLNDYITAERKNRGRDCDWQTGTDVFHWWMEDGVLSGQMELEGF